MSKNKKYCVRVTEVHPLDGSTETYSQDNIDETMLHDLWDIYMNDYHGASTSNLGYEPKNFPKYATMCGQRGEVLLTWIQWEVQ